MTTDNYQFYINKITTLEQQVARLVNQSSYGELRYGQGAVSSSSAPTIARPSVNTIANNSTTLLNSTSFSIPLLAATTYFILGTLAFNSNATANAKFNLSLSAVLGDYFVTYYNAGSGAIVNSAYLWTTSGVVISGLGIDYIANIQGTLTTVGAETLQFQWAQNTANVSDTTLYTRSCLLAWALP